VVWLLLVLMIPDVGGIAWLLLGRPERAGFRPGETTYRKPMQRRILGPDDDPRFFGSTTSTPSRPTSSTSTPSTPALPEPSPKAIPPAADDDHEVRRQELAAREADLKKRELAAWEAELNRREAELKRRESDGGNGGGLYGGPRS
jgi:hypothetical protein